ncbi:MAG TPA: FG-GAP-like repeat-containing protein, partial [Vicinamibacterales bacterium]|nr:FG-GAP-like repeat-containing protein [Vicinamibacterales bacterium]
GNGNGTFQETTYFVSGVRHNGGVLLARPSNMDAGSLAIGDVDNDSDKDIIVGAADTTTGINKTAITLLRNAGGTFAAETIATQTITTVQTAPIYWPAISTQNSPWGLALGDADGDGDLDLWVGDRALYVYLYVNNGGGSFALQIGNSAVADRPNVYLGHDSARAVVGFTPSLASGDLNGDGRADLVLGLQSGAQTPASNTAHDGELLVDVSAPSGHVGLGSIADVGTMARSVVLADVDADGALDIIVGEYTGKVYVLKQLPPIDNDGDGVSDYVDNALNTPNVPRIDLNTDGSLTHRDQLDNDADTVLGNPQDPSTWQRLGDPDDPDDDNDGAADANDNCALVANGDQSDVDNDGIGDACDPLDNRDGDSDGVADGPAPGVPLYDLAHAAKIKWAVGNTHFVIRIDALGRFFQNEFTQTLTDAATLSPADWAAKCWENYEPTDIPGYQPCGANQSLTLPGGQEVPITLVTIPKQLWTDPPVVAWINDRHVNPRLEIGQHGTYHVNNIPTSDWASMPDRDFFSCELCGLSEAENFELMKVGTDTLLGNYANKWVRESGATDQSPKIDWTASAWPLISFAPPFNASDTLGRKAVAELGFKSFSASVFEEQGYYAPIFSPEGSHHEQFDSFGMFHASADVELDPPDTTGDTYDPAQYDAYLRSQTNDGGLTTWLIEEVEWSGRPCNNDDRLGTCNGVSNRENNTVYLPRWNAWMQLLDYVKSYPNGVAMTAGEVALAAAYDNAPTVANPDQADANGNGIGDVIDGATIAALSDSLNRNVAGTLSVRLANGAGAPIASQQVTFAFDADGNGEDDTYNATTRSDGVASVNVTATRPVGSVSFTATWDGIRLTASGGGSVGIVDATHVTLDATNPAAGQVTDAVVVGGMLTDSDNAPLVGRTLAFSIGTSSASAVTDAAGHASASIVLAGSAGAATLSAQFVAASPYGGSSATAAFSILREDTTVRLGDVVATKNTQPLARAVLMEVDGAPLPGRTLTFEIQTKVKNAIVWVAIGNATTDSAGAASVEVPSRYLTPTPTPIRAAFGGDASFVAATATASAVRR